MVRDEIQRRTFERIYEADYLKSSEDPPVHGVLDALLLKPSSVVVEFGAGRGHFTLPIAKKFWKAKGDGLIFAFEYSDRMIKTLDDAAAILGVDDHIRSWPLTRMKEPDALPVNDGKVDRVLAVNSVQYLDDPLPMLTEFVRVLKPGGFAVIADWIREPPNLDGEETFKRPSHGELLPDLYEAGFGTCFRFDLDGYEWVVRAVKPVSIG